MDDIELAYTAGVVDSDGCISIQRCKKKDRNKLYYSLRVSVGMKNPAIPTWLYEMVGGSITTNNIQTLWTIDGYRAKDLCRNILPYLKGKCEQATVALDTPMSTSGRHLSNAEYSDLEVIYRVMKELNH